MVAFDEYYNIEKFPDPFLKELKTIIAHFQEKYPTWGATIAIVEEEWPMKNSIRLEYGSLTLNQLGTIDTELHRLFQKHTITFEVTSSGFCETEE
jgi:hypothetical protein